MSESYSDEPIYEEIYAQRWLRKFVEAWRMEVKKKEKARLYAQLMMENLEVRTCATHSVHIIAIIHL